MVHDNRLNQPADVAFKQLASDLSKGIDDAVETLRWCKKHQLERRASDALRLVQLNLACLALALDWQMEGEIDRAQSTIDRLWWQPYKDEPDVLDLSPTGH